MTVWRWAALAGLGVIAISVGFGLVPGIHACGLPGEPILNFEFVTSPAEVNALFPPGCRAVHVEAQRTALWLDAMGFIPVYSAFLILSLIGLRGESGSPPRLTGFAIAATLLAALFDQFEGIQLFRILANLPGTQDMIDLLMPAVRGKFALLAVVAGLIGWLHFQQPGWRKLAGAVIILGAILSLCGLFLNYAWVMQGGGITWLAMILTAFALAMRKPAQ